MNFRTLVFLSCLWSLSSALSLNEIRSEIMKNYPGDSLEIKMEISVDVAGKKMLIKSHVLRFGEEFLWMETEGPQIHQRMVRNGSVMQITDLATGVKQKIQSGGVQGGADPSQYILKILDGGDLKEITQTNNGLYLIQIILANGQGKRTLTYNEQTNRIEKVQDLGQIQSTTEFIYCEKCDFSTIPREIQITVGGEGAGSAVTTMKILSVKKVSSVATNLFQIH